MSGGNSSSNDQAAGRVCPRDWQLGAGHLRTAQSICADCLWVVGGLYGNLPALQAWQRLYQFDVDAGLATAAVFNGDFHWFDAEPETFARIEREVSEFAATAGNVEAAIAAPNALIGCGCAYPASVGDDFVERSNRIHQRLAAVAAGHPDAVDRLGRLPYAYRATVAGLRIGIIHGDPDSLAGWALAYENFAADPARLSAQIDDWSAAAQVDVFACTHTCLAWAADFPAAAVINNGAAGMPNFSGQTWGLATRIAAAEHAWPNALATIRRQNTVLQAVAIDYDQAAWLELFAGIWPDQSPAWRNYHQRICEGPKHLAAAAWPAAR